MNEIWMRHEISDRGRSAVTVTLLSIILAIAATLGFITPAAATPLPSTSAVEQTSRASITYVKMASATCGGGRCTIYLNKSETAALGRGAVPAPPAFIPVQVRVVYYASAYAHRFIAQYYANQGWCSGFTLRLQFWQSQGYFGYRC